jgi:predicted metal-binding membrane protein
MSWDCNVRPGFRSVVGGNHRSAFPDVDGDDGGDDDSFSCAVVWCAFSAAAALAQWALHGAALLSPAMRSNSAALAGMLLIFAGAFQWTPWKRACLNHCRSPLNFLLGNWREGRAGALAMGLEHGAYCAGCCWLLMLLRFVAGVMNVLWIAAITCRAR